MAGGPIRRARKAGVRSEDGSLVHFPYMPRVAELPANWRLLSAAQKIDHLIVPDRCHEVLSWGPITELDAVRLVSDAGAECGVADRRQGGTRRRSRDAAPASRWAGR